MSACVAARGFEAPTPTDGGIFARELTEPRTFRVPQDPAYHGVVVRFKPGHEGKRLAKRTFKRALRLARTSVYTVADATQQQALLTALRRDPTVEWAESDFPVSASWLPNDPAVSAQWAIAKTRLPAAWDLERGAGAVLVAVVDSGVDYTHPDLAGRVVKGTDFANSDADPMDDEGHGTHVAGVIAALSNNGAGIAGSAAVRVLAIKALGADGQGYTSDIADGVSYAVQQGASIINLSLGGPESSLALKTAVDQATAAGVLVVVAAGNAGVTTLSYPAAFPNALAVGASDPTDARAAFSNHGDWVDVAAPGTSILSTYKGQYAYMDGTSMATPGVAGVAALLKSHYPAWGPAQLRQALTTTGDPVRGFEANPALKRLNALAALQFGNVPVAGASPSPAASSTPIPTPTPLSTPVSTASPVPTATPQPSPAPTAAPTATPQPTPVPTPRPTASPSPTPPPFTLTQLRAEQLSRYQATIRWTTSAPSNGQVEYGPSTALGSQSTLRTSYVSSHAITIGNLSRYTVYYYRVKSRNRAGTLVVSPIQAFRTSF